jgi:hypothetical protein
MEFGNWYDLQLSGVVGMFGFSMEDLGLHSQKSQSLLGLNTEPKQEASKSLVLGDMLGFLQKHFNKVLAYKNPAFEFEFVGYEKDDPKLTLETDREEVGTWKALNEKRAEKGQEALDFTKIKNPADLPMNPQAIQAWQSLQQQGGNPFGDMGGMDDMVEGGDFGQDDEGSDFGEGSGTDAEGGETVADNEAWGEQENQQGEGGATVEKSLAKKRMRIVRIVV